MEYTNSIYDYLKLNKINQQLLQECAEDYIKMLAPFAPHMAEELWEYMGHSSSIFNEAWPIVNSEILTKKELNIACQVNGKLRGSFSISSNASEQEIIEEACIHAEKYICVVICACRSHSIGDI